MDAILEELKCPVCICLLKPPTHACESGHTICDDCYKRLPGRNKSCPECRKPLVMRNFTAERVLAKILQPCENKDSGCDVSLVPEQLREHESVCPWRKIACFFPSCEHLEPLNAYSNHVEQHHAQDIHHISTTGKVSFYFTPQQDECDSFVFLRQSAVILPYYVNLSLDLTTNQLHACVCSWQDETSYDLTFTTRGSRSLKVCSLPTVPVAHGDDAAEWKTHDNCFFTKPKSIRVRRDGVVNVAVVLRLQGENQPTDEDIEEDRKKSFEIKLGAAEEEQNLIRIAEDIANYWQYLSMSVTEKKSIVVMKKVFEKHSEMCIYEMVECVVDGCKEVMCRRELEVHILDSHSDMSFNFGDCVLSMEELWALGNQCSGQMQCQMKTLMLSSLKLLDYLWIKKPCGLPPCKKQITDSSYQTHIKNHHKDIAEYNLNASTFSLECDNNDTCIPIHVLGRLTKIHNFMCFQHFGMCSVSGCDILVPPTNSNDHIERYHKNMILDSKGWTESVPITIPHFDKFIYFHQYYFLVPEGRFQHYRLIYYKRNPTDVYFFVEGSRSENLKFCITIKTMDGEIIKDTGVAGVWAYLPEIKGTCQSATITFTI